MQSTVRVRRAAVAASLFAALLLAACGGGGASEGMPDPGVLPDPPSAPEPPAPPAIPQFNGLPDFAPARSVFGQSDFVSGAPDGGGPLSGAVLQEPAGVAVSADGRLFVADSGNRRVLISRSLPRELGQSAEFVLGQLNLVSDDLQDLDTFEQVQGVSVAAGKIAVVDRSGHRVLIYEDAPVVGTAHPVVVVGQQAMDRHDERCDGATLSFPSAVQITPDGKLVVADSGHSRVLIWETVPGPGQHGRAAQVVLGQPGFEHCGPNNGGTGPSSLTMDSPEGVWSDGTRVAVADTANNRVLLWDEIAMFLPTGQAPSRLLGQPDPSTSIRFPAARDTTGSPTGVAFNGTHLAVSDGDHRVLIWKGWPSANMQPAESVLGQIDFSGDDANAGLPAPAEGTLSRPWGLAFHQNKLVVVDRDNNRVLIFESE